MRSLTDMNVILPGDWTAPQRFQQNPRACLLEMIDFYVADELLVNEELRTYDVNRLYANYFLNGIVS